METPSYTGHFCYPEEEGIAPLKVHFQLFTKEENGSFSGTATDDETESVFTGPIVIKGFIEEGFISFIKVYPHAYVSFEDGPPEVDYNSKKHAEGWWDEEEQKYSGHYEVVFEETLIDRHKGTYEVKLYDGYWEMQPVSDNR